jgi:hypothetical protein
MKSDANPMRKAHAAVRCTAKSKRTGERCKGPAVRGWTVCRMHGARGGQPAGQANPQWTHGLRSVAHIEGRKVVSDLARQFREFNGLFE